MLLILALAGAQRNNSDCRLRQLGHRRKSLVCERRFFEPPSPSSPWSPPVPGHSIASYPPYEHPPRTPCNPSGPGPAEPSGSPAGLPRAAPPPPSRRVLSFELPHHGSQPGAARSSGPEDPDHVLGVHASPRSWCQSPLLAITCRPRRLSLRAPVPKKEHLHASRHLASQAILDRYRQPDTSCVS